jgi:prevent-host-death family protein
MSEEYSIYDAKAKLSALVRQVREGATFVITVHGEPVAELRPIEPSDAPPVKQTLEQRIAELRAQGVITPAKRALGEKPRFRLGKRKPGALKRFLEERD